MHLKIILGLAASIVAFISYVPYVRDVRSGKTKPHTYSWFIWALLTTIMGFAQLSGGGGYGAMMTLVSAVICIYIAILSYRKASIRFTKSDNFCLAAALITIPIWLATKNPLLAVILVTGIDIIGFWPTIRKTVFDNHYETQSTYWLAIMKNIFSVSAIRSYNPVTLIFPIALSSADLLCLLLFKREGVKNISANPRILNQVIRTKLDNLMAWVEN